MKNIKKSNILPKMPNSNAIPENALFLDVETTGFSASRNRLYLIGTAYIQGTELITEQFFAENPDEEPQLLTSFDRLFEQFGTVVTFHGNHFDLPFLEKCRERLSMDTVYHNKNYVDLYGLAHSYRHIFALENYKQKTLEAFLGIGRKDIYSGGELIKLYQSYARQPDDGLLGILLQHNYEDVLGMVQLLSLYAFEVFFSGGFTPTDCQLAPYRKLNGSGGKELTVTCQLQEMLPTAISCNDDLYFLHASESCAHFRIPLFEGTLKYFYPNYKDYFYLPDEDMALHKSVASYVEPAHRQKAEAANCYTKKAGAFLPQHGDAITPALYAEYKAPISYFEWDGQYEKEPARLKRYCMHILQMLKAGK